MDTTLFYFEINDFNWKKCNKTEISEKVCDDYLTKAYEVGKSYNPIKE
ncbi:MAG: hypothetical protein ACFFA3_16820 [Promethearchaeota archaeon]